MRSPLRWIIAVFLVAFGLFFAEGQVIIPGLQGEGLYGRGAWAGQSAIAADSAVIKPGQSLFLEPNVPNPFDRETQIAYTLDRETAVTLRVYDAFYNDTQTLVDAEVQTPGRYVVKFVPGTDYASAMYFYSLTTSAGTETRRMLFVR